MRHPAIGARRRPSALHDEGLHGNERLSDSIRVFDRCTGVVCSHTQPTQATSLNDKRDFAFLLALGVLVLLSSIMSLYTQEQATCNDRRPVVEISPPTVARNSMWVVHATPSGWTMTQPEHCNDPENTPGVRKEVSPFYTTYIFEVTFTRDNFTMSEGLYIMANSIDMLSLTTPGEAGEKVVFTKVCVDSPTYAIVHSSIEDDGSHGAGVTERQHDDQQPRVDPVVLPVDDKINVAEEDVVCGRRVPPEEFGHFACKAMHGTVTNVNVGVRLDQCAVYDDHLCCLLESRPSFPVDPGCVTCCKSVPRA